MAGAITIIIFHINRDSFEHKGRPRQRSKTGLASPINYAYSPYLSGFSSEGDLAPLNTVW